MQNELPVKSGYTILQILQHSYQILNEAEGFTKEMLEEFRDIVNLDMMEEMEVNYVANQDYISNEKAKAVEYITEANINNMQEQYIRDR